MTPTVTAALNGAADANNAWSYGSDAEMGGNLRWGVSANVTLDATVNPDFSQVEADVGQVSSNERFALFFPEKRPFFLEGIDRFDTPNRLIYTRQFRDPVAGVKLTGKVAGMNIGLLSGLDASVTNSAGIDSNPYFNALRLQRDVGGQSTIGMAYTDRVVGSDFNRVAAADARLVFGGLYALALQGGASFTRSGGAINQAPIWEAVFQRTGRRVVLDHRITGIHPDFETQAGFVNRPGVIHTRLTNNVNIYGGPGALVERWTPGFSMMGWWEYHGFGSDAPEETKTFLASTVQLRGGWSMRVSHGWESYAFKPAWYADYGVVRPAGAGADTVFWDAPDRITDVRGWITSVTTPEFPSFSARVAVNVWRDVGFAEAPGGMALPPQRDRQLAADGPVPLELPLQPAHARPPLRRVEHVEPEDSQALAGIPDLALPLRSAGGTVRLPAPGRAEGRRHRRAHLPLQRGNRWMGTVPSHGVQRFHGRRPAVIPADAGDRRVPRIRRGAGRARLVPVPPDGEGRGQVLHEAELPVPALGFSVGVRSDRGRGHERFGSVERR